MPQHPDAAYKQAVDSAQKRGIAWEFTLAEWWDMWRAHWPQRERDLLMMCRFLDSGPYRTANVYIGTPEDHQRDCDNAETLRRNGTNLPM